jgi:hypothetical protein
MTTLECGGLAYPERSRRAAAFEVTDSIHNLRSLLLTFAARRSFTDQSRRRPAP